MSLNKSPRVPWTEDLTDICWGYYVRWKREGVKGKGKAEVGRSETVGNGRGEGIVNRRDTG